jgi:glucosamine 6-phosphate synthetase-like amidotransferase/phosphosugar isomerase protein
MNRFLQDILDQPEELKHVLRYSLSDEFTNIKKAAELIKNSDRVVLTSMGSAIFSLMPMHSYLSRLHPNCQLIETSELLVSNPFSIKTMYIIMSRSGESGEIAEFSRLLKSENSKLIAITMTPDSILAKNATLVIHDPASYDGFICTKAYSSMTLQGLLIASELDGGVSNGRDSALYELFDWMEKNKQNLLTGISKSQVLNKPAGIYYLSHGPGLAVAKVAQLYTEEAARIIASHSSFGLFHHGPVEQIDEKFNGVWIDLTPNNRSLELFTEANDKNGNIIVISVDGSPYQSDFMLPNLAIPPEYLCLGAVMILQMCAYQISVSLGLDPGNMRYCNWVIK